MPAKNPKKSTSRRKTPTTAQKEKSAAKKEQKKPNVRGSKSVASKSRKETAQKTGANRTSIRINERFKPMVGIGRLFELIETPTLARFRVSFARPDDLLVCDFIFDNMKLDGTKLVRNDASRQSTLIVELPPQSFSEQAFLDKTGPEVKNEPTGKDVFEETDPNKPPKAHAKNTRVVKAEDHGDLPFAKIRMAGRSRIAFAMPATVTELPFTVDAILDACRTWRQRLDGNAAPEPEQHRFLEIPNRDALLLNKSWLKEVTSTGEWKKSTQTLVAALGQRSEFERPLAAAAKRMANRASEALGRRVSDGIREELTRAMNSEIDALARKFSSLREGLNRDVALAALSMMSTEAVAFSPQGEFSADVFQHLPFLQVILYPHKPSPSVTALELPYRLITSPIPESNWWHETKPVVHNGRTEIWHTRLTNSNDGIGADPPTKIRALWSPDYDLGESEIISAVNANPILPFRSTLDALDRQMLVTLMADFHAKDPDGNAVVPRAARSQRLALSALGALLDVEGNWNFLPEGVGLEQWRHLATLGRDHYVRVVYRGFLCPFGHSASLIKVTERKFENIQLNNRNRVAVLRQRFFIVVREQVKEFIGTGHAYGGRNFPFTSVELLTRVTPNLSPPEDSKLGDPGNDPNDKIYGSGAGGGKVPNRACLWPKLAPNNYFKFQIAATDLSGDRVTFAMPLLFVGVEANQKNSVVAEILSRYDAPQTLSRRTASIGGASVCYAPIKDGAEGDPRLPTSEMTFDAAKVTGVSKTKPQFYPETEEAVCGIAAIQRLLQQPDAMVGVAYPLTYKSDGFSAAKNPGEVFLQMVTPFELAFGEKVKSDALGGLATPSMFIQGLSRIMGPIAAKAPAGTSPSQMEATLKKAMGNSFDPVEFFRGAKILGGVDLSTIVSGAASLAGADVPKLLSKQLATKIEARFDWSTRITKSDALGLFMPNAGGSELEMHGIVSSPIADPTATTFSAFASIKNFRINLFGCIILWFDNLSFTSRSGSKPDVAVDLHPGGDAVVFAGPLEFVDTLRSIIPSNGFSDPPSLSVTPSGISASYSLNIPSVAVGIFALEHVSLGAGFTLPFDAKPAEVRFNFSERQRPFSLTVSLLGGGGFFAIGVSTEGVREVEAALEFGAALSINLGVASGSVEIKAGVYFHWLQTSVELAGYVRLHGELSVLGLISASLTFNLQLAYLKDSAKHRTVVWGEASIEVEIDVLFLSFSVSVKCRREFGGSDSDPKFVALIPDQSTWTEYCEAFAEEAA